MGNNMNDTENSTLRSNVIRFRRDLHKIPELDRDLPKTTAYIKEYLKQLPCEITDVDDAGFIACFRGGKATEGAPGIAFRSDMDALPVTEANDVDYRSTHEGKMHACGHDGHMSILLGLASEVADHRAALDQNVVLVFQAAEETTGGARDITASGILQKYNIKKIYGLHLWPGYPKDTIICRQGDFMASTLVFYIGIEGRPAHVGVYKQGIDALEIACRYIAKVYEMEKTEVATEINRLLRFGIMQSGTAVNVVPAAARLEGTLRTYSKEVQNLMWTRMNEIADDLKAKTGAAFTFSHSKPYPAVVNPESLFIDARKKLQKAGFDFFEPAEPLMISEDFSCYQQAVPGLFMHLGTGREAPLHSADYQIDEDVLITGVRAFKTLLGIG
jgi:hippurate hydrolase